MSVQKNRKLFQRSKMTGSMDLPEDRITTIGWFSVSILWNRSLVGILGSKVGGTDPPRIYGRFMLSTSNFFSSLIV